LGAYILIFMALLGYVFSIYFLVKTLINVGFENIKKVRSRRAMFKRMQENKCEGPHKWTSLEDTALRNLCSRACLVCGLVPSADGEDLFLDSNSLANLKLVKRNKELLAAYKESDKARLSREHGLDGRVIEDIYESGVSVLKRFHIDRIKELNEEVGSGKG